MKPIMVDKIGFTNVQCMDNTTVIREAKEEFNLDINKYISVRLSFSTNSSWRQTSLCFQIFGLWGTISAGGREWKIRRTSIVRYMENFHRVLIFKIIIDLQSNWTSLTTKEEGHLQGQGQCVFSKKNLFV